MYLLVLDHVVQKRCCLGKQKVPMHYHVGVRCDAMGMSGLYPVYISIERDMTHAKFAFQGTGVLTGPWITVIFLLISLYVCSSHLPRGERTSQNPDYIPVGGLLPGRCGTKNRTA
jgi:hypothetical protein